MTLVEATGHRGHLQDRADDVPNVDSFVDKFCNPLGFKRLHQK